MNRLFDDEEPGDDLPEDQRRSKTTPQPDPDSEQGSPAGSGRGPNSGTGSRPVSNTGGAGGNTKRRKAFKILGAFTAAAVLVVGVDKLAEHSKNEAVVQQQKIDQQRADAAADAAAAEARAAVERARTAGIQAGYDQGLAEGKDSCPPPAPEKKHLKQTKAASPAAESTVKTVKTPKGKQSAAAAPPQSLPAAAGAHAPPAASLLAFSSDPGAANKRAAPASPPGGNTSQGGGQPGYAGGSGGAFAPYSPPPGELPRVTVSNANPNYVACDTNYPVYASRNLVVVGGFGDPCYVGGVLEYGRGINLLRLLGLEGHRRDHDGWDHGKGGEPPPPVKPIHGGPLPIDPRPRPLETAKGPGGYELPKLAKTEAPLNSRASNGWKVVPAQGQGSNAGAGWAKVGNKQQYDQRAKEVASGTLPRQLTGARTSGNAGFTRPVARSGTASGGAQHNLGGGGSKHGGK